MNNMNKNWPTKKLGEVCDFQGGTQPPKSVFKYEPQKGYVRLLQIRDFVSDAKATYIPDSLKLRKCATDDILIGRYGASVGKILRGKSGAYIVAIIKAIPNENFLLKDYLYFFLQSPDIQKGFTNFSKRAAQAGFTKEELGSFEISLPPLSEQKKIVEKIEKLFAKIDEAERLRAETLAASVALLPSALHQLFIKIKKKWKSDKIGNIVLDFRSGFACSKRATSDKGIPQLRPNNIGFNGKIDLSNLVFIPQKLVNQEKYKLKKGDVLFNNTNSKELVGRAVLVERNLKYVFSNHITRIKVNPKVLFPEWLVVNINYLWKIGYFLDISQKWIGQAGVNTQMLKSTEIFLPPLSEQKKIVAYLDVLSQKSRELQKLQQQTAADFSALRQSILAQAFNQSKEF